MVSTGKSKATEQPVLSERVKKIKDSLLQTKPKLSCERLKFFKEVYAQSEGEPTVIRRAKLLDRILRGMTIFIDENPIVGTMTKYRVGVYPYPESSCEWMKDEQVFSTALGEIETTDEDRELLADAVDYWRNKCVLARTKQIYSETCRDKANRDDCVAAGAFIDLVSLPKGRISVDYGKVLSQGLEAVIEEARAELAKLSPTRLEDKPKMDFLNAVIISGNGAIAFARRYASLARSMAVSEADPETKRGLERIADTCDWVPAKPARTFYEAVQSLWFIPVICLIERNGSGYSPGRFSQYMFPFYREDKERGRITEEQALELLELLFIKFTETGIQLEFKKRFLQAMGSKFQNIAIGGVTADGKDATNEVDFLLLEAQRRVQMIQPTLSLLYHDKMSEEFLFQAVKVVRTGIGMPAFFNNNLNIQALLNHGASLEDARNHCIIGCVERGYSHAQNTMWGGSFNAAKMLELTLNDGIDPLTGKQIGPQTGKAEEFQSYEELCRAVKKQLEYCLDSYLTFQFISHVVDAEIYPIPFASALVDDCIKKGQDTQTGGSRYSMDGSSPVGVVDLANSLAAIKKLVFEEKSLTMKKLTEALAADSVGYEDIHRMLLKSPKYGNNDPYVDVIVREWYDIFCEEFTKRMGRCHLGRPTRPTAISVSRHFAFGLLTGALPSGRKAKMPLTDGSVSPMPGTDTSGPTALINSAGTAMDTVKYACSLLNMKFHPSSLATADGQRKLLALIKSYLDMGGHHVQFNVVSADTLKDAQLHPENYRNLIVRVAGFSAFFVHLDPVVQGEIIRRTELKFGA